MCSERPRNLNKLKEMYFKKALINNNIQITLLIQITEIDSILINPSLIPRIIY